MRSTEKFRCWYNGPRCGAEQSSSVCGYPVMPRAMMGSTGRKPTLDQYSHRGFPTNRILSELEALDSQPRFEKSRSQRSAKKISIALDRGGYTGAKRWRPSGRRKRPGAARRSPISRPGLIATHSHDIAQLLFQPNAPWIPSFGSLDMAR